MKLLSISSLNYQINNEVINKMVANVWNSYKTNKAIYLKPHIFLASRIRIFSVVAQLLCILVIILRNQKMGKPSLSISYCKK